MKYEKIFCTQMKPYYLNAIRFSLCLVWWALQDFASLRFKSGKVLLKWAGWVLKMRHFTRSFAMSTQAKLHYMKNAAVKDSDILTANSYSLLIETFKYVTENK